MKNNLTLSGIAIIIATLALLILNPINAKAQTQTIKPIYQRVSASVGGYYESLPVNYSSEPDKKYPLLIFLHGSGEKGDGSPSALPRVLRNGPPKLLNQGNFPDKFIYNGEAFSFIVVAPQTAGGTGSGATIRDMINHSLKTYRVDEQRIYLTGLSLGGLRTYNYAAYKKELTDKIAAILLVAPNAYSKEERARTIASSNVPVWLTNNDGDPLARISGAIRTVDMINAYKPIPRAKLTVFNKYGHDAWTQSYDPAFKEDGMNVYEWMLSYTTPRNRPSPLVASAGADKTITLPLDSAVLDGSVSTTGTNALKAYEWNYVNGPATPVISSPLEKTIVVKNLVEGTYTFSLKVTGSEGNSDLDTVSVIVKPISIPGHQLVANAGADQIITLPVTQTTFDGSASFAASGQTIDAYLWKKISGPIRQGTITDTKSAATTVTNFIPGVYTYQLTVTDDAGNIQADTVKITVNYKTGVLKADAGRDTTLILPQKYMPLDGSNSTAPEGSNIRCAWKRIAGPGASSGVMYPSSNLVTTAGRPAPGTYVYRLIVRDDKGNKDVDYITITVKTAEEASQEIEPLAANAGTDRTITLPVTQTTLDASASFAGDGQTIETYSWKKISGPLWKGKIAAATSSVTAVTNFIPGLYAYQLTVTDNAGNIQMDTVKVIVNYRTGVLKADAGRDTTLILPQNYMPLDGSNSTAPAGTNIGCAWKRIAGPGASSAVMYPSSNLVTTAGRPAPGTYVYRLIVRDDKGNKDVDYITITVKTAEEASQEVNRLTANAGTDRTITLPVTQTTLDASASFAGDGQTIETYSWKKISGPLWKGKIAAAKSSVTAVTNFIPGLYAYQLTVTDDAGNVQMDTVKVIVNYRTGVLKADAGRDTTLVLPQNYMPLDGSNSTAPAGTNIGCAWKRISGPGASSAVMYPSSNLVTTAGRPAPGTYVYRLIVRDDKGNNDVDYITITVKEKTEVSARTAAPNRQNAIVAAPSVKSNDLQLSVKPNPVTSVMQVQIKGAPGNGVLKVYDLQGRLIQYKAFSKQLAATSTINMEVARLHQGAYILQVVVNGNLRKAARFIKL